jgi:hypothetical protein
MQETIRTGPLKTVGGVAILAQLPVVWFRGGLVAIGARIRYLAYAVMTTKTLGMPMPTFQTNWMGKHRIQINHRPRLTMTGRVGAETGIVVAKGNWAVTVDTGIIGCEAVIADKRGFKVGRWLLAGSNRHIGWAIAGCHSHGDAMAEAAFQPDTLPLRTHVPTIVAAEATRRGLVTHIVGKRPPGDSRLLKHQTGNKLLGQLHSLIDLRRMPDGNFRIFVLVACPKRSSCSQSLGLVGIFCGEQGQHLFLDKR